MTRTSLHIRQVEAGDVTVLHLEGQLVLGDGDDAFRDTVNELMDHGRLKLVVDLADVSYIDSAGIGVLIGRYLSVRRRNGDMKLANLTNRSRRVMTITHLLTVFEAYDSVDDAVKSLLTPQEK